MTSTAKILAVCIMCIFLGVAAGTVIAPNPRINDSDLTGATKTVTTTTDANIASNAMTVDLNGDNVPEHISMTLSQSTDPINPMTIATLKINDVLLALEKLGGTPEDTFQITDINYQDRMQEVAVMSDGPNGQRSTTFFHFDGKKIIRLGTIDGGTPRTMFIDGSGNIITKTRGAILHTWFFNDEYALINEKFVHIEKNFDVMNWPVTMKANLVLATSQTNPTIPGTLIAGDSATIIGCDNVEWCQIVSNTNGLTGWFSIKDFDTIVNNNKIAQEVFEGLSAAD